MISVILQSGKLKVLLATASVIALIAVLDRAVGNRASLGILYIVPMVVAAAVLRPSQVMVLAVVCSALRSWFDIPAPPLEVFLRYLFSFIAYSGSGLFVIAIIRNRARTMENLEKLHAAEDLRHKAEQQLDTLVESSPAAIMTLDADGMVLAANRAAERLIMLPERGTLKGISITRYLPVLTDALRYDPGPSGLRSAAQAQGFRDNGEVFLANLWFSTWVGPEGKRLAAIVVDSSEEMRDREEENLRQLLQANRIAAMAVSHEVRNLCGAISAVAANLRTEPAVAGTQDLQALTALAGALGKIASTDLQTRVHDRLEEVNLRTVLDDLRIVIEPQWREIGGRVHWRLQPDIAPVAGERHGLLQAFLNLAQNSLRAVQYSDVRELQIDLSGASGTALLRFHDSGPGIAEPDKLFAPFQSGSDGTGLGLFVSRAVVRSYGGDLRWVPASGGSCFEIELQATGERG